MEIIIKPKIKRKVKVMGITKTSKYTWTLQTLKVLHWGTRSLTWFSANSVYSRLLASWSLSFFYITGPCINEPTSPAFQRTFSLYTSSDARVIDAQEKGSSVSEMKSKLLREKQGVQWTAIWFIRYLGSCGCCCPVYLENIEWLGQDFCAGN